MVPSDPDIRIGCTLEKRPKERVVYTAWLTARAPRDLVDRVAEAADLMDRDSSFVIRRAVREFLERNEDIVA